MNETLKINLRTIMLLCQIKSDEYVRLVDVNNNGRFVYRSRKSILQTGTGKAIVRFIRPYFANEEFVCMGFGVDGEWIKGTFY